MSRSYNSDNLFDRFSVQQLAVAGLVFIAVSICGAWWLVRKHKESSMREVLQREAPIAGPPIELQIPASVLETAGTRSILEPGASSGLWTIQKSHRGQAEVLQLILTSKGQKYFSSVGGEVVSVFRAGTREIRKVGDISDAGSTRKLAFTYVWTSIHPAMAMFGEEAPEANREYRGEALLVQDGKAWSVAHWTTPELDAAQEKFKALSAKAHIQ